MKELEPYIANNDGSLYRRIKDLQSRCVSCRRDINNCTKNLDYIREAYEPKYPKVLLDLSTKHKPYYMSSDKNDSELVDLSNQSSYKEIPENISNIVSNSVHVPNMISKETEYMKGMMDKLKSNVDHKEQNLQTILDNTPKSKIEKDEGESFTDYLYGIMSTKDEEEVNRSNKKPTCPHKKKKPPCRKRNKIISSPRKEGKTFNIKPASEYDIKDYEEGSDTKDEQLERELLKESSNNIFLKESTGT